MMESAMKKHNSAVTTSTQDIVLGLLAQRAMSGYDIWRLLGGLSWLVDSPSFGTLYPGLHTLLADGLATVEVIASNGRPPRKVYTITEAGRKAFQDWASQRVQLGSSLKDFVVRLALASNLPLSGLHAYLEQRREQVASNRPRIEQDLRAMSEESDLGQYLTLDYGLALADAELAWLERTLDRLTSQPQSVVGARK
jgi:DNA-binding PadR family transcriptional regulator